MPARRTRCARSQGASSCKQNRRQAGRTATAAGTNEKEGVVNLERNASAAAHHPASTQHDWQSVARMEAHGAHTAASRRQLTCTLQHNPAWLCPFVLVALQISNYDSTLPRAPCPPSRHWCRSGALPSFLRPALSNPTCHLRAFPLAAHFSS